MWIGANIKSGRTRRRSVAQNGSDDSPLNSLMDKEETREEGGSAAWREWREEKRTRRENIFERGQRLYSGVWNHRETPYRLVYGRRQLIYARRYLYPLTSSFGRRFEAI